MIGKTLGHYEIIGLLGKGGMGEVYRAQDTTLNREVAVKVLPPEFSHDLERVARFEREATTLAKLQHTNIATIYGFEKDQDRRFLVMELVEGEELAERLRPRPDPGGGGHLPGRPDRRRSRGGSRPGHRPSGSETGEHQDHPHRGRQDSRLRARARLCRRGRRRQHDGDRQLAHHHRGHDPGRGHPRHRGLHESRAGPRQDHRPAGRHLVLRGGLLRDAHRGPPLRRRDRFGFHRGDPAPRSRPDPAAGGAAPDPHPAAPLPGPGQAAAPARHRRRPPRTRGRHGRPQRHREKRRRRLVPARALAGGRSRWPCWRRSWAGWR